MGMVLVEVIFKICAYFILNMKIASQWLANEVGLIMVISFIWMTYFFRLKVLNPIINRTIFAEIVVKTTSFYEIYFGKRGSMILPNGSTFAFGLSNSIKRGIMRTHERGSSQWINIMR